MRRNGLVIFNPAAGQGSAFSKITAVRALFEQHGLEYRFELTQRPGHAIELAEEAGRDGLEAVIAAGGDGTANEVINGLMRAKTATGAAAEQPTMGVLCVGRGNDFAYGAGLPLDIEKAVEAVVAGRHRLIDVGLVRGGEYPDGRYFGNGIGIGFDTIVGFEAAKLRRIKGFGGYVVGALKTMIYYYVAPLVRLYRDDATVAEEKRCLQVSIMNGRRMGGAFYMAPAAVPDDGLLDICIAGTPKRRQMLRIMLQYLRGSQDRSPHIEMGRVRTLVVETDEGGFPVHADGETIATDAKRLAFECLPGMLRVFAPAGEGP